MSGGLKMSIKDELLKFRTKLTGATEVESTLIDLDAKVDEFIDWCDENPDALLEFSEYIEHELTKRKKFAEDKKKEVVENN